jgi:pimeloyl-ACP methyl ester carboxylesterase
MMERSSELAERVEKRARTIFRHAIGPGVDIAVADTGAGPAFLWGHGFTSSMQEEAGSLLDWDRLAARCRVVRWDARGHGRSAGMTSSDDYRWDNLGRDLVALADALGLGQFVGGGVSMGAATALHAAVQARDRVAGLVLALPPTAYETRAAQAEEYLRGARVVEQRGVDAYVELVNAQPVPEILSSFVGASRFVPAVADHLLPAVLRGAAASDLPPRDRVRSIAVPALILAWDTDPGHPLSTAERLAELLPNAELHVARRIRDVVSWTDRVETFLGRFGFGPTAR